jgi:hypothetical protein
MPVGFWSTLVKRLALLGVRGRDQWRSPIVTSRRRVNRTLGQQRRADPEPLRALGCAKLRSEQTLTKDERVEEKRLRFCRLTIEAEAGL